MEQKVVRTKGILIPLLEESYRSEYTEYSRRNLRCSDAGAAADEGEKCEREIFYDMTIPDKKSPLTSGTLVLFDDGRIAEQDIRRRLRLVLKSPERELMDNSILINGRPVSGKIDNMIDARKVISNGIEGMLGEVPVKFDGDPILEIKSVNEYAYQDMAKTGRISQSYYDQVQYYLMISGVKWAIVLIKNRNSSGDEKGALPYLEFVVMPDEARQTQIRAGLSTVAECVRTNNIPPRPFLSTSTKCSYCRFKFTCWPERAKEVEVPVEPAETVEAPGKELLEAAIKIYNARLKEINVLEEQKDEARSVIERYFKATKAEELIIENIKALYSKSERSSLDKAKIIEAIGVSKFAMVSEPVRKLLEKAVADRLIDAGVIEEATIPGKVSYTLRVSEMKGITSERQTVKKADPKVEPAINKERKANDKRTKRGAKDPEVRKNPARDKKGKSKGKLVPVGS